MASNPGATSPQSDTLKIETRRMLLELLTQHITGMVVANLIVASVFAIMFWRETQNPLIWGWWVLPISVSLIRWLMNNQLRKVIKQLPEPLLLRAEKRASLLISLSGITWGCLAWIAFNGEQANLDFVALSLIIGMTGGAVAPLSSLRHTFQYYAAAALIPFLIKSFWIGSNVYLAGGITLSIYLVMMLAYGRTTHRSLYQAYYLQLEKDYLLRDLEYMTRSRSLFLAGVSHDLKQPVQALGMFMTCLEGYAQKQEGELGNALQQLVRNSRLASAAISGQVSRLLELSRLEAGEIVPHRRKVRIADIFEFTRAQQAEKAQAKNLKLHFVATGIEVLSDLKMLQSILDNLVSNAVRYCTQGQVLVGVRRRGGAQALVEIQVWDTGPGILPEHIPLLFEAYRRFDDTLRGDDTGSGLGLTLVKKQADLLHHPLQVKSWPGKGSLFSVTLPRAAD
ncbi:MAG: HAMP domain-containing sensor histidine kinase [Methylophilaceae bacterium]